MVSYSRLLPPRERPTPKPAKGKLGAWIKKRRARADSVARTVMRWCGSLRSFPKEFNHPPALFGARAVPLYRCRIGAGATIGCLRGRIKPRSKSRTKLRHTLKRAETLYPCRNTGCRVMFRLCGTEVVWLGL